MGWEDESRFAEYERQMAREAYSRQVADKQPVEPKDKEDDDDRA